MGGGRELTTRCFDSFEPGLAENAKTNLVECLDDKSWNWRRAGNRADDHVFGIINWGREKENIKTRSYHCNPLLI
jgi:hypothetical protein